MAQQAPFRVGERVRSEGQERVIAEVLPNGNLIFEPIPQAQAQAPPALGQLPMFQLPPPLPELEDMAKPPPEPPAPELSLGERALSLLPTPSTVGQIGTGMVAGAKLAARRTPVGMAGVGLAEAAFEAGQMGVETFLGQPPPTPARAIERLTQAFTEGAVGEVGGRVITKLGAPFRASMEATGGLEAARFVTERQPRAPLSPLRLFGPDREVVRATIPQLTGRLQLADNIISGSMLGSTTRTKVLEEQANLLSRRTLDFTLAVGGPAGGRRSAGTVFQAALDTAVEAFETQKRALFAQVDDLTGDVRVNMDAVAVRAGELLAERGTLVEDVASDPLAKLLRKLAAQGEGVDASLREQIVGGRRMTVADMPPGLRAAVKAAEEFAPDASGAVTFRHAQNLRSFLLARERQFGRSGDRASAAIYSQTAQAVDQAMEASATQLAPDGLAAFRRANTFFKEEGINKFYADFTSTLQESLGSEVSKRLVAPGVAPELVEQARDLVGPEGFLKVRAQLLEEIVRDNKGALVSGDKLLSELGVRREALREFFPNGADQDIWRLARVKQRLEERSGGPGKMWIQLAQGSAAVAAGVGGITLGLQPEAAAGATVILLGPAVLARIMNAPLARRWLTVGLAAGPRTELGARAASQTIAAMLPESEGSVEEPPDAALEGLGGAPPGPRPQSILPFDPRSLGLAAPPPGVQPL